MPKRYFILLAGLPLLLTTLSHGDAPESQQVQGAWAYETLTPKGQQPYPLTGLFVFNDGLFVQHAINDGEPFQEQGGQAHYGTYESTPEGIRLRAEVGAGVSPTRPRVLSLRRDAEHHITPEVEGDRLTLTFGSGTVQKFRRAGKGGGRIFRLDRGMLALVDDHFVLVADLGESEVLAGSGRFEKQLGNRLRLAGWRWSSVRGDRAENTRDRVVDASFDGKRLVLSDGTQLMVR